MRTTRLLAALLLLLLPLAALPAHAQPRTPLLRAGVTGDGWPVYRVDGAALPAAVPSGVEFRGELHFVHDGADRAVRLLVPASARAQAPLLLALHGLYQTVQVADRDQGWGALARREGVVLAYGVGTSASWDAGTCCGDGAAQHVDDVGYLDRVVALAGALHDVDPHRLSVTGFSNGAMMAYRYACERRDRVAGVLAVAGTVVAPCAGRSDVAVLHVHGLDDRTVPLEGRAYDANLRSPLPPVSRTARSFGPRIRAELLPRFGHGWPTAQRGGYPTTTSGWRFLAAQRS